jgi:hypothetical protein
MSRTYKDRPWELQAYYLRHTYRAYAMHCSKCRRNENYACDLDFGRDPSYTRVYKTTNRWWDHHCYYTLSFLTGGVPTWFVRARYHAPERARIRNATRDAVKFYNATESYWSHDWWDEDDYDIPCHQARNSARWEWW